MICVVKEGHLHCLVHFITITIESNIKFKREKHKHETHSAS